MCCNIEKALSAFQQISHIIHRTNGGGGESVRYVQNSQKCGPNDPKSEGIPLESTQLVTKGTGIFHFYKIQCACVFAYHLTTFTKLNEVFSYRRLNVCVRACVFVWLSGSFSQTKENGRENKRIATKWKITENIIQPASQPASLNYSRYHMYDVKLIKKQAHP